MLKGIWNTIFVNTFNSSEDEKELFNNTPAALVFDKKVVTVLFTVAFSLVFIKYFGNYSYFVSALKNLKLHFLVDFLTSLENSFPNRRLFQLTYWVFVLVSFYFVIPTLILRLIFKERLSEYGLSFNNVLSSYKVYLVFFLIMVPLILLVSTTDSFQNKYPFYSPMGESLWPNFIYWQCIYFIQFFALEFFFRGFMLHGIKKRFGFYSIWVMMIPYCMIHFQKPLPETIGAILAGIALGALSLKSRSIWLGVAIHYSVAITMDLAALYQKGYFD